MADETLHGAVLGLTEQAQQLLEFFQGSRAGIDDRLNSVASRWDDEAVTMYVDQVAGNNAGSGTQLEPLLDIQAAIDRVPFRTRVNIKIRGNYASTRRYDSHGRHVFVFGCANDWSAAPITFDLNYEVDAAGYFQTFGFVCSFSSRWDIRDINFKAKTNAELVAAHPAGVFTASRVSIFSHVTSRNGDSGLVHLSYCDVDITNDPYLTLLTSSMWRLLIHAVTTTNPLSGYYLPGVAAGTNISGLPNLISNMTTV